VLLEVHARDRRAALRARLSEPVVDEVDDRVALSLLAQLERAREIVVQCRVETGDVVRRQLRRGLERRAARGEDLVGMRAADPGDRRWSRRSG
jgi:hypothetical protein